MELRKQTLKSEKKKARDLEIYNEYMKYASDPEQSRTELNKYLMKRYKISYSTVYKSIQRVVSKQKIEQL